ncbi:sortase domain-bontaining protein [Streptomyces sp. ISL-96]|uniref:sortase domain-containing protein n=1 Tax=Streptomyces sp. ISL-96 TaxID=2819191 RepID=UPI0035AC2800
MTFRVRHGEGGEPIGRRWGPPAGSYRPYAGKRSWPLSAVDLGPRSAFSQLSTSLQRNCTPRHRHHRASDVNGAASGKRGPAVTSGHVDSSRLPDNKAVFYRLGEDERGDHVDITPADGAVARYTVEAVTVVAKWDFPPARCTARPQCCG